MHECVYSSYFILVKKENHSFDKVTLLLVTLWFLIKTALMMSTLYT